MNALQTQAVVRKRLFLFFLIFLASVLLMKGISSPSVAQSTEDRELIDEIPKHLPIKVKLKKEKEKAFKDLKNEKWLRDFQLEITNTGTKPIYFLSLHITLPEITGPGGFNMGLSVHYGRSELIRIETKAEPEDVPINPGETYVFSFPESKHLSWERFVKRENKPNVKKLRLRFQVLSFGDRTGFVSTGGLPVPRSPNEKLGMGRCEEKPNLNDPGGVRGQHASRRSWPVTVSMNDLPANFLLANFLSPKSSHAVSPKSNPQPDLCCSSGCYPSKPNLTPCLCGEDKIGLDSAFCSDPFARCHSAEFEWDECDGGYCMETIITPCTSATPTPSPTPSPSPTPQQSVLKTLNPITATAPAPIIPTAALPHGGAIALAEQCQPITETQAATLRQAVPKICITAEMTAACAKIKVPAQKAITAIHLPASVRRGKQATVTR